MYTVELLCNITSRDWRKSIVVGELALWLNYNKLFLKWRFDLG